MSSMPSSSMRFSHSATSAPSRDQSVDTSLAFGDDRLEALHRRPRDLGVIGVQAAPDADTTDHLAVDDERKSTRHEERLLVGGEGAIEHLVGEQPSLQVLLRRAAEHG